MKFESLLKQMKDRLRERFSNRIGIKWGLFSGFAAFAAIILVMLWVFQIMFLGSFYKFINRISKTEIVNGARDYRLMKRKMVDAVLEMSEYNRFSKGIFQWVGFRTKWLEYENVERAAGETKWSVRKLFLYSLEGITGFSVAPLSLASIAGVLFCLISFLMIVVIVVRTLIWGDPVSGWPSLVCIIFMVGGIQLFCTGIVGQYLSKTYLETKRRPIFILKDSSDDKDGGEL